MEPLDLLADAICHRNPHRTLAEAWVCLRCTTLFSSGLVGTAWSGSFRKLALWGQLLATGLLLLPVLLDGAFVPWGSPLDLPWLRVTTGALAGLGSGLFMGARAAAVVRWPQWLEPLRTGAPVGATVAVVTGAVLQVVGYSWLLDAVTVMGLVVLCLGGTGWAWATLAWLVVRRWELMRDHFERFGLALMVVLVPLELVVVSVVPDAWKPGIGWVRMILHALGLSAVLLALLPAERAGAHLPHDTVAEVAIVGEGSSAHVVAQYLYPARRMFVISEDGGRTWAFRADADTSEVLRQLVVIDDHTMFAVDAVSPTPIRSVDGGYRWEPTGDLDLKPVWSIESPADDVGEPIVYAGSTGGFFRSTNLGANWTTLTSGLLYPFAEIAVGTGPEQERHILMVQAWELSNELFLSTDGGDQYEVILNCDMCSMTALEISPLYPQGRIYVGTDEGWIGISSNHGADWTEIPLDAAIDEPYVGSHEAADILSLPEDRVLVITRADAVFCADDGGFGGFERCDEGIPGLTAQFSTQWGHFRRLSSAFGHPDTVALAAWQGLYLSDDGGESWDEACFLRPSYIRGVAFSPGYPDDPRVFVGSYGGGLYVSPDGGESWAVQADSQEYQYLEGLTLAPDFPGDPRMFLVASRRLLGSDDSGATWHRIELPGVEALHDVVISPSFADDGLVFAVGTALDEGLWAVDRSQDGGESWTTVFQGESEGPQIERLLFSSATDPDQRIYAVQAEPAAVLLSTDAAETWFSLFQPDEEVAGLWAVPGSGGDDLVVVTPSGRVWRHLEGGQWQDLAFAGGPVLRGHTLSSGDLAVSLDPVGLSISRDGGENWVDLEVPFGSPVLAVVAPPDPDDPTLVATTHYGAFFRCDDGGSWQLLDRLMRLEDDACDVRYSGAGWEAVAGTGSGDHVTRSGSAGDTATVGFAGDGVRWRAARGPDRGSASVFIDGSEIGSVELHAADLAGPEVVFEHDLEAHGWHELRIEVTGDGLVEVDAFDVIRHRVDNGPGESYDIGDWCIDLTAPAVDPPPGGGDGCCATSCDHDRSPASAAVALLLLGVLAGLRMRR